MPDEQDQPSPERSRPQGIGDLSARVGYDVRDLIVAGYTWEEIFEVSDGELTLDELMERGPARTKKKR